MKIATTIELAVRGRSDFRQGTVSGQSFDSWDYVSKGRLQTDDYFPPNATEKVYVIFSYGTPIAWWTLSGGWYTVDRSFSKTSTVHQNIVRNTVAHL